MREERDDRLAREIIAFQEGSHGHGKVIPPDRESEENGVVLCHLLFCDVYIESNYRVKTGKWNRAIGGLSMGAYMTCDIAFANPDVFGYMGTFTASMSQTPEQKAEQYDSTGFVRAYPEFLKKTPEEFDQTFKVYFRSTTPQEDHLELYLADDELLHNAGFDQANCYTRLLYPERTSKWNSWRMGLRDYAKLIFR